jgi:hypothetical protein
MEESMKLLRSMVALGLTLVLGVPLVRGEEAKAKPISLKVGQTIRLQLSSKKAIKVASVDREGIVKLSPAIDGPTSVFLTGVAPGKARVTLVGEDGEKMVLSLGR